MASAAGSAGHTLLGVPLRRSPMQTAAAGLTGSGGPLPDRSRFEAGFGRDLSHVRVHSDPAAVRSLDRLSADAYTLGDRVAARPGTSAELMAHEVVHTFQQRAGHAGGRACERQADALAAKVVAGDPIAHRLPPAGSPAVGVQLGTDSAKKKAAKKAPPKKAATKKVAKKAAPKKGAGPDPSTGPGRKQIIDDYRADLRTAKGGDPALEQRGKAVEELGKMALDASDRHAKKHPSAKKDAFHDTGRFRRGEAAPVNKGAKKDTYAVGASKLVVPRFVTTPSLAQTVVAMKNPERGGTPSTTYPVMSAVGTHPGLAANPGQEALLALESQRSEGRDLVSAAEKRALMAAGKMTPAEAIDPHKFATFEPPGAQNPPKYQEKQRAENTGRLTTESKKRHQSNLTDTVDEFAEEMTKPKKQKKRRDMAKAAIRESLAELGGTPPSSPTLDDVFDDYHL